MSFFPLLPIETRTLSNFSNSFFKILHYPSNSDLIQHPSHTTTLSCFTPILWSLYMFIKLTPSLLIVQSDFELLNRITGMHHSPSPGLLSFLPANLSFITGICVSYESMDTTGNAFLLFSITCKRSTLVGLS